MSPGKARLRSSFPALKSLLGTDLGREVSGNVWVPLHWLAAPPEGSNSETMGLVTPVPGTTEAIGAAATVVSHPELDEKEGGGELGERMLYPPGDPAREDRLVKEVLGRSNRVPCCSNSSRRQFPLLAASPFPID